MISEDLPTVTSEVLISSFQIIYYSLFADPPILETALAYTAFFAGTVVAELIGRRLPVQAMVVAILYGLSVFLQVK